jgi:phospholipid transport system substrate-binding protein
MYVAHLLGFFLVMNMVIPMPSISSHSAIDVVENLHKTLLTVMKEGKKIGYKGRNDQLAPVIRGSFDIPFIAKTVLGRYWETFNNEQKSKFVETFGNLSIATYAYHFDAYSGERFNFILEKDLSSDQILIETQLIKSDGGKVHLDYVLHRHENQWRIINIVTDGVSDLALKRADYTAFLKNRGFDALIAKLKEKIAQYSK